MPEVTSSFLYSKCSEIVHTLTGSDLKIEDIKHKLPLECFADNGSNEAERWFAYAGIREDERYKYNGINKTFWNGGKAYDPKRHFRCSDIASLMQENTKFHTTGNRGNNEARNLAFKVIMKSLPEECYQEYKCKRGKEWLNWANSYRND